MDTQRGELAKLRRLSERILRAQDKINDLLADILKELKRRKLSVRFRVRADAK